MPARSRSADGDSHRVSWSKLANYPSLELIRKSKPTAPAAEESQLGLQTQENNPPEHIMTFRSYAHTKISGWDLSNSDVDLLTKIHDAVQRTEQRLQKEGRIDEKGYPRTNAGGKCPTFSVGFQVMQVWFDEAMLSVDRVVGRHVVAGGESSGNFVEALPTAAQNGEKEHVMLKTFRLEMYQVMERMPGAEEVDGSSKDLGVAGAAWAG